MILRRDQSRIGLLAIVLLSVLELAADKRQQQFAGVVSDSQCAYNVHSETSSHLEMLKMHTVGNSEADCVRKCVKIGGSYVLLAKKRQGVAIERPEDGIQIFRPKSPRSWYSFPPDGKRIEVAAMTAAK